MSWPLHGWTVVGTTVAKGDVFSKFVSHRANRPANQAASKQPFVKHPEGEVISSLVCVIIIHTVWVYSFVIVWKKSLRQTGCSLILFRLLKSDTFPIFCPVHVAQFPTKHLTVHLIFCSHKALSQMSTSVVEVWQPEDADPLVPLQVIIFFFFIKRRNCEYECAKHWSPNAARCTNTCVVCSSPLLCLASLCNKLSCAYSLISVRKYQQAFTVL